MPTESVWVEPLPVESANAESLEDLKRLYLSKRQLIQQRLDELRTGWSKTDEGVFAELCYCILIANRRADIVIKLVTEMEKSDLLLRGSDGTILFFALLVDVLHQSLSNLQIFHDEGITKTFREP